jgi:hypothetical protein
MPERDHSEKTGEDHDHSPEEHAEKSSDLYHLLPSGVALLPIRLGCATGLGAQPSVQHPPILRRYNEAKEQAMTSNTNLFTIGHSNHPLERFLALLARHGVEALVDIRRFPGSRKHPHFSRDNLAAALPKAGVDYHWLEALGGRRHGRRDDSPNRGLGNEGFRNYADYMLSDEFREGVEKLLEIARRKRTAIMCAEGLFWQCHRRLVSDFLVANGVTVQHIMPGGELRPHKLTTGAVIEGERVTYPGEKSLFT